MSEPRRDGAAADRRHGDARSSDPVTMAELARLAGTTIPTVSKVLNGRSDVSAATRERVMRLVDETGYRRRRRAAGIRDRETGGLVDLVISKVSGSWANLVLSGAERAAAAAGLDVVVTVARPQQDAGEDWVARLLARRSRGATVALLTPSRAQVQTLAAAGIPLVLLDPSSDSASVIPSIGTTDWAGGYAAAAHLAALGHRDIAVLTGTGDYRYGRARVDGFRAGLEQSGIPLPERPVFTLLLAQGGEFAFVVFQAAAGTHVFSAEVASLLIGAVAVSMGVTPLLLVAVDKWLAPRFAGGKRTLPEISTPQSAPVIIAGFGRYGQIVGRLLNAQGYSSTVLDHDADMVEAARAFGYKVFYGDATRLDLLRTAGAGTARVLVVAVDDMDQSLRIVDLAHEHFPHLQIVARARDVTHWNELRDRGVLRVDRELFESSLRSGRTVLELLGQSPHEARQHALRFRRHNLQLFEKMYPHHRDRERMIAVVKQGRRQLEEQMARERAENEERRQRGEERLPGWDPAPGHAPREGGSDIGP